MRGRPLRGTEPMESRTLRLPSDLWEHLEQYAAELGARRGKPVSVAEAVRQILERSMRARGA